MPNEYISAAEKVSNLADEFSYDYDLATLLRAGSSKLMKLAQEKGAAMVKSSSDRSGEHKAFTEK